MSEAIASPYVQMRLWYQQHTQEQTFDWYCDWYFKHGFVFSTPDFFIMGRHVDIGAGEEAVCEPTRLFTKEESNAWYIHAFSGDCHKAWSIMPYPLQWLAFERTREGKRELQLIPAVRMRQLCGIPAA